MKDGEKLATSEIKVKKNKPPKIKQPEKEISQASRLIDLHVLLSYGAKY